MQSNSPSLDTLSTQELEALGSQLNADMRANSAAWTQFQPSDDHWSLALILQWQADERAALSSHTQTKGE
jgi:hypothetical protein